MPLARLAARFPDWARRYLYVIAYRSIVSLCWLLSNVKGEAVPFAYRPDVRIWWDQSGTADPVLLIMGHAYGPDMWHRTAPELAASYRVIRFDNRGAALSDSLTASPARPSATADSSNDPARKPSRKPPKRS